MMEFGVFLIGVAAVLYVLPAALTVLPDAIERHWKRLRG